MAEKEKMESTDQAKLVFQDEKFQEDTLLAI